MVISPSLPLVSPIHAGGALLSTVVRSYLGRGDVVTTVVPSTPSALSDLQLRDPLSRVYSAGRPRDHRGLRRLLLTAAHRLEPRLRRYDDHLPWPPLALDLIVNPELRALLRTADVVDLQWEQYARLAPLVHRLAPRARIVATFHDVLDQVYERTLERTESPKARWKLRFQRLRYRHETRCFTRGLHAAFVLSTKDATLLRAVVPALTPVVVDPPLVTLDTALLDARHHSPIVAFIGSYNRPENLAAVERLVGDLWPRIRTAVPHARLSIIGGGLSENQAATWRRTPGVQVTGFLDDLEAAYREIRVIAAPIDRGAGVKFKILDAVIRGIPTVTTTVGAEGIDWKLLTHVSDHDDDLIEAVCDALLHDGPSIDARRNAIMSRNIYSEAAFFETYQDAINSSQGHRRKRVSNRMSRRLIS